MDYTRLITIEPDKRSGQPCIRGLRMTVRDVLECLAGGMSADEILADFPDLTVDDPGRMRLLLDQNLSHRLVWQLSAEFPDPTHISDAGLVSIPRGEHLAE